MRETNKFEIMFIILGIILFPLMLGEIGLWVYSVWLLPIAIPLNTSLDFGEKGLGIVIAFPIAFAQLVALVIALSYLKNDLAINQLSKKSEDDNTKKDGPGLSIVKALLIFLKIIVICIFLLAFTVVLQMG